MTEVISFCIPDDLQWADLKLALDEDSGELRFDGRVITRICQASGVHPDQLLASGNAEDVCALIGAWYRVHRARGGKADPLQEMRLLGAPSRH